MDICQQLEAKYPGTFQKLIDYYQSLSLEANHSVLINRNRVEKLIINLLEVNNLHGLAIQMYLSGYSLAEIGREANLSRERIRQIIKPYKKYIHETGSKEWCEAQLNNLLDSYPRNGILPSNEEIISFHPKLLASLKRHLIGKKGSTLKESERLEIVKSLNLNIEAEIKNHKTWSEERLIYEVTEFAKKVGKPDLMPMQKELEKHGRSDLRGTITRFGGQSKVARLTGLKYQGQTVDPDGSRTYWTEERMKAFLFDVAEKEGHPEYMPSQSECVKHSPKKSASIISIFNRSFTKKEATLSWVEIADKYGLKYDIDCHRITLSYIRSFVKSLGNTLDILTPAEIYVLFEQQGINKTGVNTRRSRTFDNLIQAIQSGNLPREEIDNWANGQSSDLTEALLDPKNQTVEEAFRKVNKPLSKTNYKRKSGNPRDESYQKDVDAELPTPKVVDTLDSLSATTNLLTNGSCDKEAINFLIAKAKSKLWKRCFADQESALVEAKQHRGNIYSEEVRDSFIDEYTRCQQLPLPQGYCFSDDRNNLLQPKLMQKLIAYRVLKDERVLNLSGTGTGKTLSAVLASRVIGAQLTVIACPNSTVKGWVKTIRNAFPQSEVIAKPTRWMIAWSENNLPRYLVVNHQMFQNMYEGAIKRFINDNHIDFVVIDELHQVKQRDEHTETQRRRLINGLITDIPDNRANPRVLGMSATPIINNLQEGKSLIELVSSLKHDDIGTNTTVPNCMKIYQKFTTMGFRMMPQNQKSRTPYVYPINCTPYLEELFALGYRPHPQHVETVLVKARWSIIQQHLKPKTVIFTEYVKDIVPYLVARIREIGMSVGVYTGNDKYATEVGYGDMLDQFLNGKVEILVASIRCLGTGVDGLQFVSNNVIFATLPWTSTDYEQAIGRFDREGFIFDELNIHIPKTYALLNNGNEWSWCESKLLRIENKRDVAKAAVDGEIPDSNNQLSPAKATQYWMGWLKRLSEEGLYEVERKKIRVPLDESDRAEVSRRFAAYGDFAALNARWNKAYSSTTNKRLRQNPEEWCHYHTRMDEIEKHWEVIPRNECIKHLKENLPLGSMIGDFGCVQARLGESLQKIHTVHSFDHIAINHNVFACDMINTPLDNATLDAAIFSLSLMGLNIKDYITEAYRTLKPGGQLIIYHPAKQHDREKFVSGLSQLGFAVIKHYEVYKWHYIWAIKRGHQENSDMNISF